MLHIVEGRHGADPVAQGRMGGHVLHPLAIDPHLPRALLESRDVLLSGTRWHNSSSFLHGWYPWSRYHTTVGIVVQKLSEQEERPFDSCLYHQEPGYGTIACVCPGPGGQGKSHAKHYGHTQHERK